MLIELKRKRTNRLYTEGVLYINDKRQTLSVESTEIMLPTGTYIVILGKSRKKKRAICIYHQSKIYPSRRLPPPFTIGIGHSWINSQKECEICIGEHLVPGALFKATEVYNRIFDRLEKCVNRQENITLEISDKEMEETTPISHWLR